MRNKENLTYKIRRKKNITEIDISHKDSFITFVYDLYGPNIHAKADSYPRVADSITQRGLKRPTMAEIASLVYQAFLNPHEPEFSTIKDIMKNRMRHNGHHYDSPLWVFTGTLYTPDKGAYVEDNPKIKEKKWVEYVGRGNPTKMDESELIKRLKNNDPKVRFVPYGYEIGRMTPSGLARNPYVIALAGKEGAEKLAEVADEYGFNPYLRSIGGIIGVGVRPTATVSRKCYLDGYLSNKNDDGWSYREVIAKRLCIIGEDQEDLGIGFAFGIKKPAKSCERKIA